jgi:hypothetical protein
LTSNQSSDPVLIQGVPVSYRERGVRGHARQHLRHNACMDERRQQRAARMTVRRYASSAEADRDDLGYWRQMPDAERVLHTWRLSVELWRLRGDLPDEPGLCRSVARIHRR